MVPRLFKSSSKQPFLDFLSNEVNSKILDVVNLLKSCNQFARSAAICTINELGKDRKWWSSERLPLAWYCRAFVHSVPCFVELLRDQDPDVQNTATKMILRVAASDWDISNTDSRMPHDNLSPVRFKSESAIKRVIPQVVELLNDKSPHVRIAAKDVAASIAEQHKWLEAGVALIRAFSNIPLHHWEGYSDKARHWLTGWTWRLYDPWLCSIYWERCLGDRQWCRCRFWSCLMSRAQKQHCRKHY